MQSPAYPADVQHDTASRHPRRSVWPRGHQAGTDAQPHAGKPAKNVLTCTDDTQARRSSAVVLGEDHPHTLHSAHNLAIRLWSLGEREQARALVLQR